jgi:hypothetical protein
METESRSAGQLPESMVSCFGRAVHAGIGAASKEDIPREAGALRTFINDTFVKFASEQPSALHVLEAITAPLAAATFLPAALLIDRMRIAIRTLSQTPEGRTHQEWSRSEVATSFRKQIPGKERPRFGIEVPLELDALELAGRADSIEKIASDVVRITEFKTGAALDDELTPTFSAQLQVCAYALMRRDRGMTILVRIMAPSGEWEREFSTEMAQQTEATVRSLLSVLPRNVEIAARTLAQPGAVCITCRQRRICTSYREWAVSQWQNPNQRLPRDTWGEIEQIDFTNENLRHIRIRDGAGRGVHVTSVPRALVEGAHVGTFIEAYGLTSTEVGRGDAFPCNFSIADSRRPYHSAYSAEVVINRSAPSAADDAQNIWTGST